MPKDRVTRETIVAPDAAEGISRFRELGKRLFRVPPEEVKQKIEGEEQPKEHKEKRKRAGEG